MSAFTPEQEARIAEIVRAAIAEARQQEADEAARLAEQEKERRANTPFIISNEPIYYNPPPQPITITAPEIILDAERIIATVPIEVRPAPGDDAA